MRGALALCITFFWALLPSAQQTSGLFINTSEAFNGYTLFSNNEITYLINNCGFTVNTWESTYNPGNSVYLLNDGSLLRSARVSGDFNGGGRGGRFERFSWDGELLWHFNYADSEVHAHHDIAPLPNGNFLAIAWEKHSEQEARAAGRSGDGEIWSERIIEVRMHLNNGAEIVWEWRLWDHLIQDYDSTKENFGVVADHPELVDINVSDSANPGNPDWIHMNAIDYNADLDQIVVSSRAFNEIWIIDHSTTSEEASGHSGGNSGKGGDLLYRYGNPQAYQRSGEQVFFRQHDVRWIPPGYPGAGSLMVFNNDFRQNGSAVHIWQPPLSPDSNYVINDDMAFGPDQFNWTYTADGFYSRFMSGAQMQPNGNVLVCEAESGRIFEITPEMNLVWEYINPVNRNGSPAVQGGTVRFNELFRAERYAPDYPAFEGRTLEPGPPVELLPWDSECDIYEFQTAINEPVDARIKILGNPVHRILTISASPQINLMLRIYNLQGLRVFQDIVRQDLSQFDLGRLPAGMYLAKFDDERSEVRVIRFMKLE